MGDNDGGQTRCFHFGENVIASSRPFISQFGKTYAVILSLLICILFIHALSVLNALLVAQRFPHAPRSSTCDPRSSFLDFNDKSTFTPILSFVANDPRNSLHLGVQNRWQCNVFHGSITMHGRVVPGLTTFNFIVEKHTSIKRQCIAAYRPRRKRGRIKTQFEWRKPGVGKQKSVEVEFTDEKMTLPTPVSNQLPQASDHQAHGVFPSSPLRTATIFPLLSHRDSRRWRTNRRVLKKVNPTVTVIGCNSFP